MPHRIAHSMHALLPVLAAPFASANVVAHPSDAIDIAGFPITLLIGQASAHERLTIATLASHLHAAISELQNHLATLPGHRSKSMSFSY